MAEPVIEVQDLTKRYDAILAVDHINFSVGRGSTCGLLGANGAGKTTTLAMLLGLVTPSSGTLRVLGEDMVLNRYRVLPRMNFSSPYVDLPQRLTVRENLNVYGRLYGVRQLSERLRALGAELEIAHLMDRVFRTLSAGQKTRVILAKSLLNQPELLLLDEPTASLDPDTADRVRSHLQHYQRATGATILLASHNMVEVERVCDHVMIMRAGRIEGEGTPAELIERYGRATLEEVFLDIARNGEPSRSHKTEALER